MKPCQDRETRKLRIQLLGTDDPSADEDRTALGRWKEYVASYVLRHPTEWLPRRRAEKKARAVFLKRWVNGWIFGNVRSVMPAVCGRP